MTRKERNRERRACAISRRRCVYPITDLASFSRNSRWAKRGTLRTLRRANLLGTNELRIKRDDDDDDEVFAEVTRIDLRSNYNSVLTSKLRLTGDYSDSAGYQSSSSNN